MQTLPAVTILATVTSTSTIELPAITDTFFILGAHLLAYTWLACRNRHCQEPDRCRDGSRDAYRHRLGHRHRHVHTLAPCRYSYVFQPFPKRPSLIFIWCAETVTAFATMLSTVQLPAVTLTGVQHPLCGPTVQADVVSFLVAESVSVKTVVKPVSTVILATTVTWHQNVVKTVTSTLV